MPIDKIYVLGPEGTYSGYAARRYADYLARTGQAENVDIWYTRSIPEALELASQSPDARAVAPIENSETGAVIATQDHLAKHGLFVEWEINVKVRFSLVSDVAIADIARVYAHPVAFEQCDIFTAKNLRAAEVAFTRSNVDSGVRWSGADPAERAAAMVPSDYEPTRPPSVIVPNIQNNERNTTRFVVVRGGGGSGDWTRAKTSLLIEPDADRPGLLFEILSVFKKYDINLCRIESRPERTRPWAYVFYLDITNNEKSAECARELFAGPWRVILLGTYDALPEP
jgi:prephenate dehydratase